MSTFKKAVQALAVTTPFVKPVFLRVMDVSTSHITKADNDLLMTDDQDIDVMYDHLAHGFFVYLRPKDETDAMADISEGFKILMHWAREAGATHIRLDADGTHYPQLPTFDW